MVKIVNFNSCDYCSEDLDKKSCCSEWHEGHHYKTIKCGCGKKVWQKVSFLGSGHDDLFQTREKLESTIKKVREG